MSCDWGWTGHWLGGNTLILILLMITGAILTILFLKNKADKYHCPTCQGAVENEYLRCPHCGTTLKKHCPGCSGIIKAKWNYCPECQAEIHKKLE
ncbi:MAG: zinc ribbon domain-containing protein [Desulfobulbaceae bacterium]|nr:zinc ribbon domain-containing protein [Desulfobulbaceae bacterium]